MSIVPHLREGGHRLPVGAHRRQRRRARVGLGEAVVAGRDREARRHPLDVVLERPGQRLIEVVHVEQQPRSGEANSPKFDRWASPHSWAIRPGHRRVLEVRRHDLGRAPVEGERRDHHPAMPHRHQVLLPGGVLLRQQGNRVRAVRGRPPLRMTRQSRPVPGLQALGLAIVDARMRDLPYRHPAHLPLWPPTSPGTATSSSRARLGRNGQGAETWHCFSCPPDGPILGRPRQWGHHP